MKTASEKGWKAHEEEQRSAWLRLTPAERLAWLEEANEGTLIVAHIETVEGYEKAAEILTAPHLDMVYVGPYDLSIAMGHPGDYDHPEVVGPMLEILALCRRHRVPFGTTASSPEAAARWIAEGCRFFEAVDELGLIREGARSAVAAHRRA